MNTHEIAEDRSEGIWEGEYFQPKVDIVESETHLIVKADVPGIRIEDLDIDVTENVLTLTGKRKAIDERWKSIHKEFDEGHYFRKFRLGMQVDQSGIEATCKGGVLEIHIPMQTDPEPRKINIKTA